VWHAFLLISVVFCVGFFLLSMIQYENVSIIVLIKTPTHWPLPFLHVFAKLQKATIGFVICLSVRPSVHLSVHPRGTTRLLLDRFSWNLIFECFSKTYWEIQFWLIFDKNNKYFTWRCMYSDDNFHKCLAELLVEWDIIETKVAEKIRIHFMFNNVFKKIMPFMR
jgi:hypothetical protein